MIKLMVNNLENPFETTKFPDGTSQVWKIKYPISEEDDVKILWQFENEAEMFHVAQLAQLVQEVSGHTDVTLVCPYLPYGRQDKDIGNKLSFALKTFKELMYSVNVDRIETYDAHSTSEMVHSTSPTEFHKAIFNHDIICFPDAGAASRYSGIAKVPTVHCQKVRDQLTGAITGLQLVTADRFFSLKGKRVLIIDDICDGGMTFIKVAELLKEHETAQIDLAVSHGLFSKGKQVLHDAGITNIYTTNSLLRNPEGFNVVNKEQFG